MSGWRNTSGKTQIVHSTEEQLDKAIADLEKRGYVLVKKAKVYQEFGEYNNTSRKVSTVVTGRWQAELRRG